MFSVSHDDAASLVVHYLSGPTNTDADYAAYCSTIERLNADATGEFLHIGILTIAPENPMPNASWRKRIADASSDIDPNTLFILVSERPAVRGILTAINWVRPPTYQWCVVKTFEGALDVVREHRPEAVARVKELHEDCLRHASAAG